ncbi:MAG TPA: type II secretion system F family protein [Candidatus Paceibacterota bacterium]|nr:type II secretion system F family protein [Candidatus Paceibacterota bacterium]
MLFKYSVVSSEGEEKTGTIDAANQDVAITSLQRKGFIVSSVTPDEGGKFLKMDLQIFEKVSNKEVVILSRQISTLFESHVSALRVFRLLAESVDNPLLSRILTEISNDIQGGLSISAAMKKHPKVFTDFYVNMVRSGEESGRLNETFLYLAEYLDRTYEIVSKSRNALIYPAFVILVFVVVMVLMLTMVIPQLTKIIKESGQEPPIYTQIVIAISDFLVNYGLYLGLFIVAVGIATWLYGGRFGLSWGRTKISLPYMGPLFRKFYLSRIADNLNTMITSGIPMVRTIEITASVVGNSVYEDIMKDVAEQVRGGNSVSSSMAQHPEIPNIMIQMTKVGEETGELGTILATLAKFYRREVDNAVDTMISLIEPAMIVALGLAVGVLLASVLMPIYNLSSAI